MITRKFSGRILFTALCALLLFTGAARATEALAARVIVDQREVERGQSIRLQIQVQGSNDVAEPDLSALTDFSVQATGSGSNNRTVADHRSGRREVFRMQLLNYRLTPRRTGTLTIPALTIVADGRTLTTEPVTITVKAAQTSNDFMIRMDLPSTTAFVGEVIPLTTTWFLSKQPRTADLAIPALKLHAFSVLRPADPTGNGSDTDVQIPLNNEISWGRIGRTTIGGTEYTTITITRYLTPTRSGELTLEPATATCEAVVGYRQSGRRSPFGDFFGEDSPFANDPFFTGREEVTRSFFAESAPLKLTVLDLPAEGRPSNFSGLVGQYSIAAQVEPEQATVGEPLTLSVMIAGSAFPAGIQLPPLQRQENLAADFRLTADNPQGEVVADAKVFTLTLRAKHAGVQAVPPLELNYFNPRSGRYETARSPALPVRISAARVVTAGDIEGGALSAPGQELASSSHGLFHNYDGAPCLRNQPGNMGFWRDSLAFMALLVLPPLMYFGLLGALILRRRMQGSQQERRSSGAFRRLCAALDQAARNNPAAGDLLELLRDYCADRLLLRRESITLGDITAALRARAVTAPALENLRKIYEQCEAGKYAGAGGARPVAAEFMQAVREAAGAVEGALK